MSLLCMTNKRYFPSLFASLALVDSPSQRLYQLSSSSRSSRIVCVGTRVRARIAYQKHEVVSNVSRICQILAHTTQTHINQQLIRMCLCVLVVYGRCAV